MFGSSSIGQRVGIGFMLMLILLCLVVSIASVGIDYVVESAGHLMESNKLRADLMQHEIDHLDWEDSLYAFLTDSRIENLTIQLDDHQCKFGKWLYGPQRLLTESHVPELIPLFKAMEEPHRHLHQSAKRIKATFRRADHDLPSFLLEQIFKHLQWLKLLSDAIDNRLLSPLNRFDITKCPLEKWLQDQSVQHKTQHSRSRKFLKEMQLAHNHLHAEVNQLLEHIEQNRTTAQTTLPTSIKQLFFMRIMPELQELLTYLKILKNEALKDIQAEHQYDEILRNENLPNHAILQQLLHKIRVVIDKNMVTDEEMLLLAQHTRNLITGISILTLFLAAFMAVRTGRDIVTPLSYLTTQLTMDCVKTQSTTNLYTQQSSMDANQRLLNKNFLKSTHFHSLSNYIRLFILWRKSDVYHDLNDRKNIHDNIFMRLIKRTNIMRLFSVTDMPTEVESLVRAIRHYTECQTKMVMGQQQFIADVAHQLKNPLAGIYIQIDMMVEDAAQQSAEQHAQAIKLREAIHRVGRLTHQLLALARCSPEAIDSQAKKLINLQELIEENASAWFDAALPKHIDLGFEIESVTVHGVSWLLSEMLINLVDNAIKYSPTNARITVRCGHRNNVAFGCSDQRPFLEVEDNGFGIPAHAKDRIFERFYRASDTKNSRDGSVGLGLAIVKEVTKYHHATIEINSPYAAATGTRFSIEFPYSYN